MHTRSYASATQPVDPKVFATFGEPINSWERWIFSQNNSPADRIQKYLLVLSAVFLFLYSAALTLSPVVRARSWEAGLRWEHWLGYLAWLAVFSVAHRRSIHWLQDRDPFLLSIIALLSGWGLMTIWRLYPGFGLRQTAWLIASGAILIVGMRFPDILTYLKKFKYLWLTSGLLLTALTLIFGTNPSGSSPPKLWLGCCGVFIQPSEPLKLLLIAYLSAYLADRRVDSPELAYKTTRQPILPLIAPTLMMTGLAMVLLLAQRDLGTAAIFILLYTGIVYVATGRKSILLAGLLIISAAGVMGYFLFDVVRLRIDAWINPWLDPSGRAYQIVQSLIAIANGGLIGRGIGLGFPSLVPVAHSDFIFVAIFEEMGLVGASGLLLLYGLLATRSLRISISCSDQYRRYLAFGLALFLVGQSLTIIGGNLRLLPLTGVTLPFVSYGGSSLVVSFISGLILLQISNHPPERPAFIIDHRPIMQFGILLLGGLAAASLAGTWWVAVRGNVLLTRTDNPRRAIADRFVKRGSLLDRNNIALANSAGVPGELTRSLHYPALSSVIGYSNPVYGQAGLEASLDAYLRGQEGTPTITLWWNQILYGQPPPGLDVRLSLDLSLQKVADAHLADQSGAVVLLNANSGEVLAAASHPTFDANRLEEQWATIIQDPASPLVNRVSQGMYPAGSILGPFLLTAALSQQDLPPLPDSLNYELDETLLYCAITPTSRSWSSVILNGCPRPAAELGNQVGVDALVELFKALGFFSSPDIYLPTPEVSGQQILGNPEEAALGKGLFISPLQLAAAGAALSNHGERPALILASSYHSSERGWIRFPLRETSHTVFPANAVEEALGMLDSGGLPVWQATAVVPLEDNEGVTWFISGTQPEWEGSPFVVVVLLETENPILARNIGEKVIQAAMQP